ncbi:polysaccharide deacetylase family protein [Paenibacillus alginolyticus]|uniref:Polysaccharide deacetylase family protein n=1 Tax=Paenibacillus alginolyticus TaxID=59839 RepID=A0ABT4GE42_9BACL|nr:polysaccharide deacetylase family protein [Paenibacillus alginolyticus]MCY9694451.1 polysaccharide deacetylase family protein [Paenibacillus alginolyticus]MEC0148542.1 polysaccharide deacetylase family protein [Paenibacillus alginolyticus]
MTKWLWSIAIAGLLTTGCGVSKNKPIYDQRSTQNFHVEEQDLTADSSARNDKMDTEPLASPRSVDSPFAAGTPATSAQPEAASTALTPKPSPKPSPKKAAAHPESSKKPSVPVQKNQGQARISQKKLTLSQLVVKYPDTFKVRGSAQEKKVALTFDDGPDTRFTPKVLDALKASQVKATFFVLGSLANAHPDMIRRIVNEGHVIGNHSYSHANLPKLTVDKFQSQIMSTESVLQGLIGYAPKLIRPPYGAINEEQVRWIADHHYLIVNWNVDSLDWKSLNSDQVLNNIMQQTKPGSIILQHSGGADSQDLSGTVQAIGPLISKLKAAGYTFVTVPELLHVAKGK